MKVFFIFVLILLFRSWWTWPISNIFWNFFYYLRRIIQNIF